MKFIFPIILLVAAIGIFYFFTDPTYQVVKGFQAEMVSYNEALDNSKKLQSKRDELLDKYNTFPSPQVDRLEKMVPDNVDNVRLVLEIDRVASTFGMAVKNIKIGEGARVDGERSILGGDEEFYGTLTLEFSVDGPYRNFVSFLNDLERSLRIVDINSISFSSPDSGVHQFNVKLSTYWLK